MAAKKSASRAARVKGFRRVVVKGLKKLSPRLTKVLAELIAHEYPEEFWQLDFEVHEFRNGFPVVVYFYCEGFDQVMDGEKRGKPYPFKAAVAMKKVGRVYLVSDEKKFRVDEDEYWFEDEAAKELIPWFQKCWAAAGGKKFKHRARLAGHDTAKRLDLVSGKWTRDG